MSLFLDPVQILVGPDHPLTNDCVLIKGRSIESFGDKARSSAKKLGIKAVDASNKLIAPCLVDPHSILEEPFNSACQTLASLRKEAAKAGYGQIGLLPQGLSWRDRPERLLGLATTKDNVMVHLWGSFSVEGKGKELSPHKDLIKHGAIGLAEDDAIPSSELLKKGFTLGEMGKAPVLIAPRAKDIQGIGLARESVEALRAGWPLDPFESELIPLSILIALQSQHPEINIRLMNLSTAKGIEMLSGSIHKPLTSVSWWHLVADSSLVRSTDMGWGVRPSLGSNKDRENLIKGLEENLITGVAVHATPLDAVEMIKPIEQRSPGISGHNLVLPSLWEALVVKKKWTVEQLWNAISFGPSRILNQPPEKLSEGSNRWLLFNPSKRWNYKKNVEESLAPANQPYKGKEMIGAIEDCGLIEE